MEKIILTDVDSVLLNWLESFEQWMIAQGNPRRPNSDHEWNIAKRHYNVTFPEAMEYVHKFNHSDEMRKLAPCADAVKYVAKLAEAGFKFIAVTSMSDDPQAKINREYNLKELFGDVFLEVHCLKVGESKQAILGDRWGGTGYLWIEDHFKNAEAGYEVGLSPLLVDTEHNRQFTTTAFPRVNADTPWESIYNIALKHYK